MAEPLIVARADHSISRRLIDPDALKVLYRLKHHGFRAYLVGGSVRDLLLGRRPKDFDVGTDAHPYQIKKLFRNCWIIGRRFRLAHVKFGPKTIEVATFRRESPEPPVGGAGAVARTGAAPHRENTFGTPEEDAFRRDFTVNALFYDIATFSVIDYVGGLRDLEARVVRAIGDPDVRFREDPVRMLRAVVLAARLDFQIDPPVLEAIARNQALIAEAAPARLLEEYYKILRSGAAERTFRALAASGLLRHVTPELEAPPAAVWRALAALDTYRAGFEVAPDTLTNAILVGTLLVPLGRANGGGLGPAGTPRPVLGSLPVARRDVERLRQITALARRLLDVTAPERVQRRLAHRPLIGDALTWLAIHGERPEVVAHWRDRLAAARPEAGGPEPSARARRRRRRRRARKRPAPGVPPAQM